jgi:hypothetical protein
MIVKACIAGALALALDPIDFGPTTFTQHPYVEKVQCDRGSGTAFKIKDGRWLTVAHVSENTGCQIDGKPITTTYVDEVGDFSIITFDDNRTGGIEVNCNGFKDGEWYFGIGHGKGYSVPQVKAVRYSAILTFFYSPRWAILVANRFVPGMSGGVVLDQTGRAVGLVNAYGTVERISFSRELARTNICQSSDSARP